MIVISGALLVVLLHLLPPSVESAGSFIRGGGSDGGGGGGGGSVTDDTAAALGRLHDVNGNTNDSGRHHRALQTPANCAPYSSGKDCKNQSGCEWSQGACVPIATGPPPLAPTTPQPTTPQPTTSQPTNGLSTPPTTPSSPPPPPVTSAPTDGPSKAPTNLPSKSPSDSPTREGHGTCSDDGIAACLSVADCGCYPSSPAEAVSSSGNLFDRRRRALLHASRTERPGEYPSDSERGDQSSEYRALQTSTSCTSITKRSDCLAASPSGVCNWVGGLCVSSTKQPTKAPVTASPSKAPSKKPTNAPSKTPTGAPTKAPTPCVCLGLPPSTSPTMAPSNEPTTSSPTKNPNTSSPSKSPTSSPIKPSSSPTRMPSRSPTLGPSTVGPTESPTTSPQTSSPTESPSTRSPTVGPSTGRPTTFSPTSTPSTPSASPSTMGPTKVPSRSPARPTNTPTKSPTRAPMVNPPTQTPVIPLQDVGDNGSPVGAFPLGECQGDCDADSDCQAPLICYQRNDIESVPGCSGTGISAKDYCASRSPSNLLFLRYDAGYPLENLPLGPCDGDCDLDADCDAGLICSLRSGVEEVPGCVGTGASGKDYCRHPSLVDAGDDGGPAGTFPLGACEGDCDNDDECEGTLMCFQRADLEPVPGCLGLGTTTRDYCADRSPSNLLFLKGQNGLPAANFPLGLCEGDCDSDAECALGLACHHRDGLEEVPGCAGLGASAKDYCKELSLVYVGNNGEPAAAFPLGPCEGDCDTDDECEGSLQCFQRAADEDVVGCAGTGTTGTDYCAVRDPINTLFLKGDNLLPSANFPLGACDGDCDSDADCAGTLLCSLRDGVEEVSGCVGLGVSAKDYCYDPNTPTSSPIMKPTYSPNTFGATYVPGDLSVPCDSGKLMLSKGMACRLLTTAGQPPQYADGTFAQVNMHTYADGAGVIPHPTDGGWYYVSNSEASSSGGGVGTLRFDSSGNLIGYTRTLTGTTRNCGGGRTYWRTWVSCEEDGTAGGCHEVDPHTGYTNVVKNVIEGGNYESFAYDDQDPNVQARFFTTEDTGNGPLVRYTPHPSAFTTGNSYDILNTVNGVYEYLVLNSVDGTFSWSTNMANGEASAAALFPNSEGIDVHNRILNFVSKTKKQLFTLDLAAMTWTVSSTLSGAFDLQPDQLGRIIGDSDMLYFCEDGGSNCDIHGRDATGKYFTIVRGDGYSTETSGLAFSPDNMFMYIAFQGNSNVYALWREDGLPFNGQVAYTKYH